MEQSSHGFITTAAVGDKRVWTRSWHSLRMAGESQAEQRFPLFRHIIHEVNYGYSVRTRIFHNQSGRWSCYLNGAQVGLFLVI